MTTTKKATRSGNPAVRAQAKQLQITSAEEWAAEAEGALTELPSGKVVRMILPGMHEFVTLDLIPNSLMPFVEEAIQAGGSKPMSQSQIKSMADNKQMLLDASEAMDRIFVHCVTEPIFQMPPTNREDREKGVLYVDMVGIQDKQFVFQRSMGGTVDLEQFRKEQSSVMETISAVTDDESTTE
jgi:hypothetical protein